MAKIDKKKDRLKERIAMLEEELRVSLTQKSSSTAEINVPAHQRKIQEAKLELKKLG